MTGRNGRALRPLPWPQQVPTITDLRRRHRARRLVLAAVTLTGISGAFLAVTAYDGWFALLWFGEGCAVAAGWLLRVAYTYARRR